MKRAINTLRQMNTNPDFGSFIRARREALGASLNAFAQSVQISPAYWSRIERGQEKPPKDALIEAAARALGISMDEAYVQAGRLPPDMRERLPEIVAAWRKKERRAARR